MTLAAPYHHIAEPIIDQLTPFEGWLYVVLARLIPRKTNRLPMPIPALAKAANMSQRSVIRHTEALEKRGLIEVERQQEAGQKVAQTNVYSLAGQYASVTLGKPVDECQIDREGSDSLALGGSDSLAGKESSKEILIQSDDDLMIFSQFLEKEMGDSVKARLRFQLERLGQVRCLEIARYCKTHNPYTWDYFLKSMENATAPVDSPTPLPPSPYDPVKWEADDAADDDTHPHFEPDVSTENGEDTERIIPVEATVEPSPEELIWRRAMSQIEIQLDRASFDTWVRSAHFLGCADGVYRIGVANPYARDMCQHRLYRDLRRVVWNIANSREIELHFEVHKLPPEPEGELPLFKLIAAQGGR